MWFVLARPVCAGSVGRPDKLVVMRVRYVTRAEWGASAATEAFIRDRWRVPPDEKTSAHVHHTAAIDTDGTPNTWALADAAAYMRKLETVRPDLGPLPYNENWALGEDADTVYVLQGRGLEWVGAHASGWNRTGIGFGWLGNFNDHLTDRMADQATAFMQARLTRIRHHLGYSRLGDVTNPHDWQVFGHRDTAAKDCPGHLMYPLLARLDYTGDADMPDPRITDAQAETLAQLDKAVREMGSSGGFARWAIALIREFRGHTVDSLEESDDIAAVDAEVDALAARVAALDPDTLTDTVVARIIARLTR